MASYYPVFLNLKGRACVVIGGGRVAEGKVRNLTKHDCSVTVVSPRVTPAIGRWASQGRIAWLQRPYREGDLKGAFLAIAATNDNEVNRVIAEEAEREKALLNVVDYPPLCAFIAPAIVERGPVTIAISTSGASPALARKLRETLEGSELVQYADLAGVLSKARREVKRRGLVVPPDRWQEHITMELVEMARDGREAEALELIVSRLAEGKEAP